MCTKLMISINVALAILVMMLISGVLATSNTHENCIDIDCLKEKLRLICETDPKPEYLDCENILRCIDVGEQQVRSPFTVQKVIATAN